MLPENDPQNLPSTKNNAIKMVPPASSYFHETIKAIIKAKAGMLCLRNANSCLIKGSFPSNTSKENIIKNRIEMIERIRANHNKIFSIMNECF